MSEVDAQQSIPRAASRSWKLTATVMVLAILPLLLPFSFALMELKGIYPVFQEHLRQCTSFDCGVQTETDWERLGWLVTLGPSLLIATIAILLGTIGCFHARRHPISPKNRALFRASVTCGGVWAILFCCLYGIIFYVTGLVP